MTAISVGYFKKALTNIYCPHSLCVYTLSNQYGLDITDINNLTTPSIKLEPPVLEGIEVLG